MKGQFEVLFYLDNNDVAIIEVGQAKSPDLKSLYNVCFWFIYHKTNNSINRFIFKANVSRQKLRERRIKKGLLKLNKHSGTDKYVIEIDEKAFDFIEQNPEKLSKEAKATIEKYLDAML
jgi:hypothetical protein